ncbi:MAG: nucleoside recognition domain-containing protein [Oscillospiraceae bacterium]|jgi:spore maturation protein A
MVVVSIVFSLINGTSHELGSAVLEGASSAVSLTLAMAAAICLWSGVLEILQRTGAVTVLARILRPVLRLILPGTGGKAMEAVAENVTANLLGLGNAATPAGIRAIGLMANGDTASDDMCTFIVLNTASIQIIPATVAGVRASAGAIAPFDILPAVWVTSASALIAGLTVAGILKKRTGRHDGANRTGSNRLRGGDG